jgi:hypothetical protein
MTVEQVLVTAQNHLNDWGQDFWTKEPLLNFLQESHKELQVELASSQIPIIRKKTAVITIASLATNLNPNQPIDLVEPAECWERPHGSVLNSAFTFMYKKAWLSEADPGATLGSWSWIGGLVTFIGATGSVDVKLYYNALIPVPQADQDDMGFTFAELYIAPRLAAKAARSLGGKDAYSALSQMASDNLGKIIVANRVNVRKPYTLLATEPK